jgi:SAM-dependent methyltransferase
MDATDGPGRLLEISGSYWQACALQAAAMLDVFTPLCREPLDAPELAARLGCDARALAMLLDALAAMGLLTREAGRCLPTAYARAFLDRESPRCVAHVLRHHHRIMGSWAKLPEAVRTGRPLGEHMTDHGDPGAREDFLLAMDGIATAIAPGLAARVDLSGRRRFLDVGGGPGTYASHFCLANPELTATVFDLPGSREYARAKAARLGVADRLDFHAGDYLRDPMPAGYDVAWLSQILHAEDPAGCRVVIAKAVASVVPGGLVFVHEFMLDDARDGPLFATLFSLNMLLGTPRGQAYAEGEIREMLEGAGVGEVRRLDFAGPNGSRILCGRVPAEAAAG